MKKVLDTDAFKKRDRAQFWHDLGSKLYADHTPIIGADFSMQAYTGALGDTELTKLNVRSAINDRAPQHVRAAPSEAIFVGLHTGGDMAAHQDDRSVTPELGGVYIIDSRRPFVYDFTNPTENYYLRVPVEAIEQRIGPTRHFTAIGISPGNPLGRLSCDFLRQAIDLGRIGDPVAENKIAETALDMIALTLLRSRGGGDCNLSYPRLVATERLSATIRSVIGRPEANPEAIAAAAGMSVRYANRLLAEQNTSIMRMLYDLRFENCRRILADVTQLHRSITDIALYCGFSDMAHFSRTFKKRYGLSPSDYRLYHAAYSVLTFDGIGKKKRRV